MNFHGRNPFNVQFVVQVLGSSFRLHGRSGPLRLCTSLYIFTSSRDWNHHLITSCGLFCPTARSVFVGVGIGGWGGGGGNSVPFSSFFCVLVRTVFSCTCQHAGCYAAASSLALANMRDVTLPHLLLHLPTCGTLRCRIFSCTCQHAGCYAAASSLALANMRDVTLPHLLLHLPTCGMLRCRIFSCTCQNVGCSAAASSLALTCQHAGCYAPTSFLHLPTCGMLRRRIFSCNLATEQQKWGWSKQILVRKNRVLEMMAVQNPLQIRPHGISWHIWK